jgi:peptidoglycan biosynthesis protein MviN/MurJ (putative lipid II flippase)
MGISGLALGIALGAWFEASVLTFLLQRRHRSVDVRSIEGGGVLSVVGAVLAALVAAGMLALDLPLAGLPRVLGLVIELGLASAAGLAVYVLYSRLVRLPELARAVDLSRAAVRGR